MQRVTRLVAVLFPDADTAPIERFRARYDPLAALAPAHITVAYPFLDERETEVLRADLEDVASEVSAFSVALGDPSSADGEYVFLLVKEGAASVRLLHDHLYSGPLAHVPKPTRFVPHMTVGRTADPQRLTAAVNEARSSELSLTGVVHALSIYRVHTSGERHVECEVRLRVGA